MAVLFLGLADEADNSLRRLTKTYDQHLQDGLDPDHAATKAVTLLTPGPVVGRCWLVFLISGVKMRLQGAAPGAAAVPHPPRH